MQLAVTPPRPRVPLVLLAVIAAGSAALAMTSGAHRACDAPPVAQPRTIATVTPDVPELPPVEPLAILATAERRTVAAGEKLPLEFAIENRTSRNVLVLRSLDASDVGWRFPKIAIEIRDRDGDLITQAPLGRCGLVNPLTTEDFVELAPGERHDLFGDGSFGHHAIHGGIDVPGVYTVTLVYNVSFEGEETKQARPDADPAIDALIDRVPFGVYRSAPIELQVTGF